MVVRLGWKCGGEKRGGGFVIVPGLGEREVASMGFVRVWEAGLSGGMVMVCFLWMRAVGEQVCGGAFSCEDDMILIQKKKGMFGYRESNLPRGYKSTLRLWTYDELSRKGQWRMPCFARRA